MARIPVKHSDGTTLQLTPGQHNELIKAIIEKFGAIYAPGGAVLYVGDTGDKFAYFDRDSFSKLDILLDDHGKMPDVVIHHAEDHIIHFDGERFLGPYEN
jgi:hypothetical protein